MPRDWTVATILGNPVYWEGGHRATTPEQLATLREIGFDTVFANLAWSRPWMDAVNLEDLHCSPSFPWLSAPDHAAARARMRSRVERIVAAGLRPFFLFGAPKQIVLRDVADGHREATRALIGQERSRIADASVACTESPAVRTLYRELLEAHFAAFPETAGLLLYTVDELAEVCDERDDCPRCHGVPLERRLPGFLAYLADVVETLRPGTELWWEPWEFTASQVLACAEVLDRRVTLCLHKCIHEVYLADGVDSWLRRVTRAAEERGLRVIVEMFLSGTGEDLGPLPAYPAPRLVWEQLRAVAELPAVSGIKEYFGTVAEHRSVNDAMLRLFLAAPSEPFAAQLRSLLEPYPSAAHPLLEEAWEAASRALEWFPWELSWRMRQYNSVRYDQHAGPTYWSHGFASTLPTPWTTPSWESSRLSFYQVARTCEAWGPRLARETADCLAGCLRQLERAEDCLGRARALCGGAEQARDLALQARSLAVFGRLARSRMLHVECSCQAEELRAGGAAATVEGLATLLEEDLANCRGLLALVREEATGFDLAALEATERAMVAGLAAFRLAPARWLGDHLL